MNAKHFILGALMLAAPALAQVDQPRTPQQDPSQMQRDPSQMQQGQQGRMMQPLTRVDRELIKELHKVSLEEIRLGEIAEQQGTHEGVKRFGRMMVDDHTKGLERLTQLGQQQNIPFERWEEDVRKDLDRMVERYTRMSGDRFDRQYLTKMVKDHDKVIKLIDRRMDQVSAQLQPMLTELLPTLRQHHQEAQRLLDDVKAGRAVGGAGDVGMDYEHDKDIRRQKQRPMPDEQQ